MAPSSLFFYPQASEWIAHSQVVAKAMDEVGHIVVATTTRIVGQMEWDTHIGPHKKHLEIVAQPHTSTQGYIVTQ